MGDILNFNPDRPRSFDPNHERSFDSGRTLTFAPNRSLDFDPGRDLAFGHRGVVFRGFICPICGSQTTEDATKCTECGASFEHDLRAAGPTVPIQAKGIAHRQEFRPPEPEATPGPKPPSKFCVFCGATLKAGDGFCWNCGSRAVGNVKTVKLPEEKAERVTRDWANPKER